MKLAEVIEGIRRAGAKDDDEVAYIDWGQGWDHDKDEPRVPRIEVLSAEGEPRRIAIT